jgi:peroxiredoxin
LGISVDDPSDTAVWAREIGITFPLLSDRGGKVSKRFGLFDSTRETSARAVATIIDGNILFVKRVTTTEVPSEIVPWREAVERRL